MLRTKRRSMNLAFAAGDVALQAADSFESFLFSAAAAHTNGFKTVWSMYGKVLTVGGAAGGAVAMLSLLENAMDKKGSTNPVGDSFMLGLGACMLTAYITNTVYRERMYQAFTGSGTLKFKLGVFIGCIMVPAASRTLSAQKGQRKNAFVVGAALGTLLYILVGCIPVIIQETQKESEVLVKLRALFDSCYPWNEASPCADKDKDFVRIWTDLVPDWINRTLRIKEKANLLKVMDLMITKQKLDVFRAIGKTPLVAAFGGWGSRRNSGTRNSYQSNLRRLF